MANRFFRHHRHSEEEIQLTPVSLNDPERGDIQDSGGSTGYSLPRNSVPVVGRYNSEYAEALKEISRIDQGADKPIFIPRLLGLRRKCFDHISTALLELEKDVQSHHHDKEKVERAVSLLRDMDALIESEAKRLRMEDPDYAASRGLSVVHFQPKNHGVGSRQGNWMMLSKKWGQSTNNIVDPLDNPNEEVISEYHLQQIEEFMGTGLPYLHKWTRRAKTTAERQRGTLKYAGNGEVVLHWKYARAWQIFLLLSVAALILFYGVGIIATNTRFSPIFERYFFWIAIFWSLISSALLSWVVKALGGTKRDVVAAMLTGIGIWLVVIQIGQTRLNRQLEETNGG